MKISERKLYQLILEEIDDYLEEAATCHDPETGFFDYCKKGNVYSLSKRGADAAGVDKKYVSRGKVSSDKKNDDGTTNVTSKFGMNTSKKKSAGRVSMPNGADIEPRYSVSKYPKKYEEQEEKKKYDPNWPSAVKRRRDDSIQKPNRKNWFHGYDELDKLKRSVGLGVLEERGIKPSELIRLVLEAFPVSPVEESSNPQRDACRKLGLITLGEAQKRILMSLNAFALAHDGKLNAPKDKQ